MTAFLYQSGSSSRAKSCVVFFARLMMSHEIVEVLLPPHAPAQPQDVGRRHIRIERDVIFFAMPKKTRAAQKIVRLIRGIEPQRFHWDFNPPRLHMVRI